MGNHYILTAPLISQNAFPHVALFNSHNKYETDETNFLNVYLQIKKSRLKEFLTSPRSHYLELGKYGHLFYTQTRICSSTVS